MLFNVGYTIDCTTVSSTVGKSFQRHRDVYKVSDCTALLFKFADADRKDS